MSFWILEETELTERLNWVARVLRTDWVKMMLESMHLRIQSVSSLVQPLRFSFDPMVLELSLLTSELKEDSWLLESTSWGSCFLKKLRVYLELYLQISLIRSLKDLDQNS